MDKRSADTILASLKTMVEEKQDVPKEVWLDAAFFLNNFVPEETKILNGMRQEVAQLKLDILKGQEKQSVARAEIEVEASDLYRLMRDQEAKVETIKEFVRIAKKSSEDSWA